MAEQTFEKHTRYVPGYHFVALPILLINFLFSLYQAFTQNFSKTSLWNVVVALALALLAWYVRSKPVGVQNRIIRLEERLRLREKLPADLHSRINEIPPSHLIGLRFASDEELPDLARRCINGEFKTPKEIKSAIKTWRPDAYRV